ncbi:hypothetical protein [Sphingomonas sp. KR3-1]|uniref:hypothetical protein n=1 Tax=Sphingomonas sp. KR3-1 TaxID=3156611 RepID=UPI0032B37CD0
MASVGSILGGAFGLLRERPVSVVIWAVTYTVGSIVLSLGLTLAMFGAMTPDPQTAMQPGAMFGSMFGLVLLVYLAIMFLWVVVTTAAFRAMLRPEDGGFAFMRLGMDELRMFGLLLLIVIVGALAMLVCELLLMLVVMIIGLVLGQSLFTGILTFLLFLGFIGAVIWVYVRISLLMPLSFYRGRISVDGAWALTRGRFWTLFGAYFLVALIFFIVGGVFLWSMMGGYVVAMMQAHGDPAQVQALSESFAAQQFATPIVTRILYWVVGGLFAAAWLALGPGTIASATRELLDVGGDDEASVFAAESDESFVD